MKFMIATSPGWDYRFVITYFRSKRHLRIRYYAVELTDFRYLVATEAGIA